VRSLYLRIFVWFWVAMVAVAVVLIVSSPLFTRSRPGVDRWQGATEEELEARLEEVAARVANGSPGPMRMGRGRDQRQHFPVFVLAPDGSALGGMQAPEEIAAFARRVAAAGEARSERSGVHHFRGRPVIRPDGERLIVVAAVRRPPRLVDLLEPAELAWRLAALTLVAGLLCFWLARQLSAPVAGLRATVRQLAGGDLSARVADRVAGRGDEIGDLARDFNAMAARLEGLVGSQRRLVRDVSHELRSPLARLRVALELERRRANGGEALERIEREAGRLDELIGQILTLSRLEAAEAPASDERVDLSSLAAEVADDASFEGASRGVRVALRARPACVVTGEREALRSALENVVRNAVRYTAEGTEVRVGVEHDGANVVITVRDRGPGAPPEHLDDLFAPFFRLDEARERGRGGAGLGLAIAARAVRLHGGAVAARNHPEGGLEVVLRLPGATPGAA